MAATKWVAVPGSRKTPVAGARVLGPARADERFEVTIRVRPRNPLPDPDEWLEAASTTGPKTYLTHEAYESLYGADPKDVKKVRKYAKEANLTVVSQSLARRSVILSGTVADFNAAFNVQLHQYEFPKGVYRGRTGSVHVPDDLAETIEGVFGLDNRPYAKPHFQLKPRVSAAAAAGGVKPFDPTEVAKLYNFPTDADGTGQCIGILELGGGYRPQDLDTYFKGLGFAKTPNVLSVGVDGGTNHPAGTPNSADGEVVLDIEIAAAVAPGATIAVYFAPTATSKSFLDALTTAIHDTVNNPSVISISWGGAEQTPTSSFQTQFNQALQAASMLGITVCVASGDNGAADLVPSEWDGQAHVDFPSASPFALACGGTRLIESGGAIASETVWNQGVADTRNDSFGAAGGGISAVFGVPSYQKGLAMPSSLNPSGGTGRGVPDVSGVGDPETGFIVLVDGQQIQVGGTSAVAPLWAGLLALINQKLKGRVGFINTQLYALTSASDALNDVTGGSNKVSLGSTTDVGYDAGTGWDAASGLGSPNGVKLAAVLTASTPSPTPAPPPPGKKPKKPKKPKKHKEKATA